MATSTGKSKKRIQKEADKDRPKDQVYLWELNIIGKKKAVKRAAVTTRKKATTRKRKAAIA